MLAAAPAFGAIVLLGARNGGFFPDSWGWAALPLLLIAGGLLFTRREVAVTPAEAGFVGLLALLTAWTALSALWAPNAGAPVAEAERSLLYVAALGAVVLAGGRRALPWAVLAAAFVLSVWALADKLLGHGPSRLEGPIGYTNGLGLVAATGILLAVGLARRQPLLLATIVVFGPTLLFTYSRGSWLALAAGLVVLAGLAARRRPRLLAAIAGALVLLAVLVAVLGGHGAAPSSGHVSGRLSSLSGNGRGDYWRAALDETRAHPLLGGGAGTWERWWLSRRPDTNGALDAHQLYLETLAELGPLGLALLAAALALPLLTLRRALRHDWAPACAAAYVALLVHAALDWDWELPAVALCGLFCGAALLAGEPRLRPGRQARAATLAAAVAAAAAVFALQVGNAALQSASTALDAGNLGTAAADARRAQRWQPWATEPQLVLGEAQLAAGDLESAARTFEQVVARDPGDAEAWYQLALATPGPAGERARSRAILLDPHGPAATPQR